jgi:hypothetical protein
MKNGILILFTILSMSLIAQDDETLFDDVHRVGGWGGPLFEYTNLDTDVDVTSGGGGALILDDFYLGGYGMGKTEFSRTDGNKKEDVNFKHGGFWIGYTPLQRKVVHPYGSVRFGWGKTRYESKDLPTNEKLDEIKDNIFVMNPELGIEVNVFSFFRIAATASYRLVNGVDDIPNYSDDDFSGFGATLTLRFGGFGSWDWDD